ncbi:MAG TPA: DUF2079 domain-containing protein [Vicinamibacterales bacterium]|jgi:uncharacterized membrane protein|nr:DUF2079 domain-containing protein [Vicinamibacterales bacterium]
MSDSPRSSPRASIPPRVSGTLLLLTIGFAIAYACISLFRHWHFGSGYDLAIFDQAIWRLSHFDTPASTLSRHANIFGDHFSPILIVLTPIYWLAPAPETLLVAQALLLASSIVPVHLCLRMRLDPGYAWPLTISYALFWGIQRTALSDFHELAFAPLLLGLAVLAALRGRWGRLWIYVCLICLTKEDLVPFLGGLGLYLTWTGAKRRGLLLIVTSIVAFLGIMTVVIPWLNGGQPSAYAGQYADLLARPWLIPVRLLTPMDKSETVLFWLLPFLFLPLFSSLSVLAVPIAIARLLSPNPNHWGHGGHYSAPLAPLLAMAAGDALSKISGRIADSVVRARAGRVIAILCVLSSALVPGHQPLLRLLSPGHYRARPGVAEVERALRSIPPDASVVSQAALAPHLSHRNALYLLESPLRDADYVVVSTTLDPWPLDGPDAVAQAVDHYLAAGFQEIFRSTDCTILRRSL